MTASDISEVRARLKLAIETGEVIGILYHGGSQPGAYRQITPIQVGDNQVQAHCYMSNTVKIFALDKIELRDAASPTDSDLSSIWDSDAKAPIPVFTSVAEIAAHYRSYLEAEGWHVEHHHYDEGESLCLYGRLKNGKLRKYPTVSLTYEATTYDLAVTPDGGTEKANLRPRVRPWSVTGKGGYLRTWSHLEGAVRRFLDAVASEQPS
jgi:hypothetical protein